MDSQTDISIRVDEGRFARFGAIKWWNQQLLRDARVLVIGAGAIGNEVIKNLALLGVGNIAIVDMDRIEQSNLSRSILFTEKNEGQSKAAVAAEAAKRIYSQVWTKALDANVLALLGLGWFRWA